MKTCQERNKDIIEASGNYVRTDRMVSFFYELMRGHLAPGKVEKIVQNVLNEDPQCTTVMVGWRSTRCILLSGCGKRGINMRT